MAAILRDKIRLLLTAAGAAVVLIVSAIFFREYVPISRGWRFFVGGSVVYNITALYLFFRNQNHRHKQVSMRLRPLLITKMILLLELPVFVFFLLFYFERLSLPEQMWPYWLASLLLAPLMLEIAKRVNGPG